MAVEISPAEVRDMILNGDDFILVDIRNNKSYVKGHLRGAICAPFGATNPEMYEQRFPKDKPMVVYCYRGGASAVVADKLTELGYQDVRSMKGGHWSWRFIKGEKPTVKGNLPA